MFSRLYQFMLPYYFLKSMISYRKSLNQNIIFFAKVENYFRTIRAPIIYFIEGRSLSRPYRQINNRGFAFLFIALLIWLMYQCPNGEIPSRNCIIKAPAKWKNFVYVMTEFCHQRIKWLCPKFWRFSKNTFLFFKWFFTILF